MSDEKPMTTLEQVFTELRTMHPIAPNVHFRHTASCARWDAEHDSDNDTSSLAELDGKFCNCGAVRLNAEARGLRER